MAEIDKVQVGGTSYDITNTKNTAGTTNKTGTKMFIAAATEQSANPQTYSNSNVYIGTDNCLYSGGTKVLTSHQDISGKVNGPSSATNNAVAIFDGTGGKTIKNSGFTIGKSVPSDAVFTDTWRPVQDNLTSTSTTDCLSANQGKVLNGNLSKLNSGNNITNDILADAINCGVTTFFYGSGSPYTGSIPDSHFAYGTFIVNIRGSSTKYVVAISDDGRMAVNSRTSGAWSGWNEFALNSNVANVETATIMTGVNSLSVFKTSLQTIADGLAVDKHKLVRFYSNFTSNGFFANLRYKGYLMVYQKSGSTATDYSILFEGELGHNVLVNCHDNTWYIEELALNSKIITQTYSASDVITAGTNVTVNNDTHAYKTGNMVELYLNVTVSASVSSLGTLKTAVRPKHSFQVVGLNNNDDKAEGNFNITNNGGLDCYGLNANKQYIIHATYVCE